MSSRLCAQGEFARGRVSAGGIAACKTGDEQVLLRDGSCVVIRPLASGDAIAIDTWFAGLGPETRYARFLARVKWLDSRTRSELAHVDHRDHEAITAVAADGTTIAIARYLRVPQPGEAEVAVAVADRWRGRGIASLLLRRIAVRARAADIPSSRCVWCRTTRSSVSSADSAPRRPARPRQGSWRCAST